MNFKEFINQQRNLDKIIRFSAKAKIRDMTVSEHSYHVAFYAMMLADLERKFGNKVDVEKVLRAALVHDLEEVLTGDILSPFKRSDSTLAEQIQRMGFEFMKKLMSNLPENLSEKYVERWVHARDKDSLEGKIVQAADWMEALLYAMEEYSMGNKGFEGNINEYAGNLKSLNLSSVGMILEQILGEESG